ncbi:MAG: AfsR/SARP family transcriptional regulator [Acidimicrobiales bacterium]
MSIAQAAHDSIGASGRDVEIEVAVLGPAELRGVAVLFTRSAALDLVVYLAMHPAGVANETWATALWPDRLMAPATLHSTASAARRSLGRSAAGFDHLPRSHGRLRLGPGVTTDWRRFEALAGSSDPVAWSIALDLVRGRPFDGLRCAEWTVLEGLAAQVEDHVAELAGRLSDRLLEAGRPARAAAAARRGLLASPYDERLYRRLLVCADVQGHPAGVERVMAELLAQLDGDAVKRPTGAFDLAVVHPETAALYERLSRRPQRGSGGPPPRQ